MNPFLEFFSLFGDPIFWGIVLVLVLAAAEVFLRPLGSEEVVLWRAILAFLIIDTVFIVVLKRVFATKRPLLSEGDKRLIGPLKYAFPSGHASVAFGILLVLIPAYLSCKCDKYDKYAKTISFNDDRSAYMFFLLLLFILFVLTVLVCMSRLWLNKHFFVDLVGGIVVGAVVSIPVAAAAFSR